MASHMDDSAFGLDHLCSMEDLFHRHLLPFLMCQDVGRLERASKSIHQSLADNQSECWKVLVHRDYCTTDLQKTAPFYNPTRKSFDTLQPCETWKHTYQQWKVWQRWTHDGSKAQHMVEAIEVWRRLEQILETHELHNVLHSLEPSVDSDVLAELATNDTKLPSSLIALYSVHGGQRRLRARSQDDEFFGGLLGSYSCYDKYHSMRLIQMASFGMSMIQEAHILVGVSPGNPRIYLYVHPTVDDPEGVIQMVHNTPISYQSIQAISPIVGRGGFLAYLRTYVERLEAGVYSPTQIIPESPRSRGIGLFPNANLESHEPWMSRCVTRGMEVCASARWFPDGIRESQSGQGLNFGYSVRIQMLDNSEYAFMDDTNATVHHNAARKRTCQLVGRQWEFTDGNGRIRRVEGQAVIGKQPLFFRDMETPSGRPGYIDLGPAGEGSPHMDEVFVYQSQSGPVADTTQNDTKAAQVQGTFSFVPGSIESPTGPLFYVKVAAFPLTVPFPFY